MMLAGSCDHIQVKGIMQTDCAIILNTSDRPMAAVVLVDSGTFHSSSNREEARAGFRNVDILQGLAIVMATQSGDTIQMNGDANLVSQLSRQDWMGWNWFTLTIN
jgi:hypothetical protein